MGGSRRSASSLRQAVGAFANALATGAKQPASPMITPFRYRFSPGRGANLRVDYRLCCGRWTKSRNDVPGEAAWTPVPSRQVASLSRLTIFDFLALRHHTAPHVTGSIIKCACTKHKILESSRNPYQDAEKTPITIHHVGSVIRVSPAGSSKTALRPSRRDPIWQFATGDLVESGHGPGYSGMIVVAAMNSLLIVQVLAHGSRHLVDPVGEW